MRDLRIGVALVITFLFGVLIGTSNERQHLESFMGRQYDDVLKYEKDLCLRSDPVNIPCAVVFIKYTNVNWKGTK